MQTTADLIHCGRMKAAVNRFLNGQMASWAGVFCVTTSGDPASNLKYEKVRAELACDKKGIKFEFESREGLWHRLRNHPQVVERHLGKHWADESRSWSE